MSDNHEFIIPAGNPVKKFPSRLQELYLSTPGFLPCWQKSIRKGIFRVHGTGNILPAGWLYCSRRDDNYGFKQITVD